MKLQNFQNSGFEFSLGFENGQSIKVNLNPLIGKYISKQDLASARLDSEWGCLEFCDGSVDVDPSTLYRYAVDHGNYNFKVDSVKKSI